MLISFFKKSFIPQYMALLIIHVVLWLPAFLSPGIFQHSFSTLSAPGSQLLFWLFEGHPLSAIVTAFILVFFTGIILNYTLIRHGLAIKNSLLSALIFLILAAHQPWLIQLHPGHIPAFILIIILFLLFDLYNVQEAYSQVFHSGFLLALATLFYFPMGIFLLMFFFTFIVYRLLSWREWTILFIGFITVYLFVFTTYFWIDQLPDLIAWLSRGMDSFQVMQIPTVAWVGYAMEGIIIISFFLAFIVTGSHLNEKIISVRKRFWVVIWAFIIALISFLFSNIHANFHLYLLVIPVSIIFSFYLSEIRKTFWPDLILMVLTLLIMINNFYTLISESYF